MLKIPRMMAAMLAALTAALLLAGAALAQPGNPGHYFYGFAGDVTLDGNSLPGGTTISAQADGEVVASGMVLTDGSWSITVPEGPDAVVFAVGDAVSSVSFPVSASGVTPVKLALTTPEPEPEPEEPAGTEDGSDGMDELEDGSGSMDELEDGSGSMDELEDGSGSMDELEDGSGSMDELDDDSGTMELEGDDDDSGSMQPEDGDADGGSMQPEDGDAGDGTDDADEGTDDGDGADEGTEDADEGTEDGDGADDGRMPAEILDEEPPTDEPTGTDGDDGVMDTGDAMPTDEDADGVMDTGDAMPMDEDADGVMDTGDAMPMDEDADEAVEEDDGTMDTVGGVNALGATGTGGLADGGSSAALWGGIGSALALLALLGGGFAIRRRSAQRS